MNVRAIVILNWVLAAGLLLSVAFVLGRQSAEAQPVPASSTVKIALVDFTKLGQQVNDVKQINTLVQKLAELRQINEDISTLKISMKEKDLQALRDFKQMDTEEWEEENRRYREYRAEADSHKDVFEFRMKRLSQLYAGRLLKKILTKIEQAASNRYDIVFKVLGDPTQEEIDKLGAALGEQVVFNLSRAREILYFSKNAVTEITGHVVAYVNRTEDPEVTGSLKTEIAGIDNEIAKARADLEALKKK